MEEFELEPGETITRTVHQHPFLIVLRFVPYLVLALLPLLIVPVFNQTTGMLLPAAMERFILGVYWLFVWLAAFRMTTRFFLTLWIITSHRIVDITQYAFFDRRVSSFLLSRVQDITTNVEGLFPTLIGYG